MLAAVMAMRLRKIHGSSQHNVETWLTFFGADARVMPPAAHAGR